MREKRGKSCFSCKKEKDFFHEIVIPGIDEEEDDLGVPICESCLPFYQEGTTYLFHILGGSTFPEEQRPPFWYNEVSLLYKRLHVTYGQLPFVTLPPPSDPILTNELERSQFPLERFPLIDDFEVLLERMMRENQQEEYSPSDYGVIFLAHRVDTLSFYLITALKNSVRMILRFLTVIFLPLISILILCGPF